MSAKTDEKIEQLLRDGCTLTEIEKKLKTSYVTIKKVAEDIGWDVTWRNKKDKYKMHAKKYDKIYDLIVNKNKTLQEVGDKFGISRERVRQILEDMDIRIRDLKSDNDEKIKEGLFDLLITGKYTPQEAADKLDVSHGIIDRVIKTLSDEQINEYRANYITNEFYKTKEEYKEKMKVALEMWDSEVETEEIATAMGIKRAYLNQLIIKCRKRYGWFPAKYAARFEPTEENEYIRKLIIKDRRKRDPELDAKEREKEAKAKAERARIKEEKAKEKARKEKEKQARIQARKAKAAAKKNKTKKA